MASDIEAAVRVEGLCKAVCDDAHRAERYAIRDALLGRPHGLRAGERWAVEDVCLSVARGETVGILGAKLGGASLLARVVGRVLLPDAGTVEVRGSLAFCSQLGKAYKPMLTVWENLQFHAVLVGAPRAGLEERCRRIVTFAGLVGSEDRRLQDLTRAQVLALGFSTLLHVEAQVLVLANVAVPAGDPAFHQRASAALDERLRAGTAIVFAHRAHSLPTTADRVLVFHDRGLVSFADKAAAFAFWEARQDLPETALPAPADPEVEEEPDEQQAPADPTPPADVAAAVRDVTIGGVPAAIDRTTFVFSPGEVVTVEFTLEVEADLACERILVRLNAADVRQPLAIGAVVPQGEPWLRRGTTYRCAIEVAIPRLQRGRFGVTASVLAEGKRPLDVKLFAFGTRTDQPPGTAAVLDVRAARIRAEGSA